MKLFNDEKAVSELVGALLILLIVVVYIGTLQAYEVTEWNKEIEKEHFEKVYGDFINLRSNFEDVSVKNIPKTGNLEMGVKYPDRFMLQNPGPGASGILNTYPIQINISYITSTGKKWKNYSSMGFIYRQNGISESPLIIYENGLLIQDYGNGNSFVMDDKQPLTTEDNIFIPIINGDVRSVSTMDASSFNIQPISKEGFQQVKFESMNVTIETRYPHIWKNLSDRSRPAGSNFSVENGTNCPYGNSDCLKITYIPGYYVKKLNLPSSNQIQFFQDQVNLGMVTFDNSLLGSRGPTGPDGQDMWEKNQGRLDIPASNKSTQFIIKDITLGRSKNKDDRDDDDGNDDEGNIAQPKMKFSVTDSIGNLWTIEIKFRPTNSSLFVSYVKQNYPKKVNYPPFNVSYGKYNDFNSNATLYNITNSREIDLTKYYQQLSNITTPNALTIDRMDPEILYVNFVIN